MAARVVCISRTAAAGGETIGQVVAHGLGFQYVDEQIIERAAQQAQVAPALVAKAEHRQPLLRRLLDKMASGPALTEKITAATGIPVDAFLGTTSAPATDTNDLRLMIQAAIHEVAAAGQAVIVAHAASMALAGSEGVLRVLVTASMETRIRRVAEFERIILTEAERRIAASDRERGEYFKLFYKLDEELPTHYDLIINTDALTAEQGAAMVLTAARAPA